MGADDVVEGRAATPAIVEAVVEEELPSALYRLRMAGGPAIVGHVGERRDKDFLRLLPGDRVEVRLSPFDKGRGKILRRIRQ